ncbi:hypothetical protein L915_21801 [Phytophthora nicotianae]|uniref:Uncharacterized protein n=1 Tax=Phytophthora nicotianae TaxID=4792 RepID=W2FLS4_PHYNI|nr:hypothetical protein L915_21801 [Phytophthora nicotianae]
MGASFQLQTNGVEADLLAKNAPTEDIRSPLSITYSKRKYLSRAGFVGLLGLEPGYDAVRECSVQEFSLLKQLRAEQVASNQPWSNSNVVSMILYNCAVERLDNSALNIRKRGFRAVYRRKPAIDDQLKKKPIVTGQRIILTTEKTICDDVVTPDEDALMQNLFAMLRTSTLKHKTQLYTLVYTFAAANVMVSSQNR